MNYPGLQADILQIFVEAQNCDSQRLGFGTMKPAPRVKEDRRAYMKQKAREYEMRDIRAALASGIRPKKWGKRWKATALAMGISPCS